MPQSTQIAAFILGAVLLLIALLGGRFKIFGGEVSDKVGMPGRLVAFVLSLIFFALGLIAPTNKTPSQSLVYEPSPGSPSSPAPTQAGTPSVSSSPGEKEHVVDLSGHWKDSMGSVMHIVQHGSTFEFTEVNDSKGSSAKGHGTIGTNHAEVEFTLTRIVAGQPIVTQGSGTLTLTHDHRTMQANFKDSKWEDYGEYFVKQ